MEITSGETAFAAAGIVAIVAAWYLVREQSFSIWRTMGVTLAVLGVLSLLSGRVRWGNRFEVAAIAIGLWSGVALYALTRMFFRLARPWVALHRQTENLYRHREGASLAESLGVGGFLASSGEELFWRGLVQDLAVVAAGPFQGTVLAWGLYVAANFASASLPILLGAAVGGAAWGTLAWWSGGVAASVACHVSWTALMIARPPT